jgi:hypothetical protein
MHGHQGGLQPTLMSSMMHRQRHAFLDTATQAKRHRVRVTDFVQCPVLVVRLQRQTTKLPYLRAGIGVPDCLIDPGRAEVHMDKRLAGQGAALRRAQRQDAVRHRRVEYLQAGKLVRFGTVQTKERKFKGFRYSAHAYSMGYLGACARYFRGVRAARTSALSVPVLNGGAFRTL